MDFSRSDDQLRLYADVVSFARSDLQSFNQNNGFVGVAQHNWQQCADFGVLGWAAPGQYGGHDYPPTTSAYLMEALGFGCDDNGLMFALGTQIWGIQQVLLGFGDEIQKKTYVKGIVSGRLTGSFAINEPASGSDALSLSTTAVADGDDFILDGEKCLISMAPAADFLVVLATTNPEAGRWGISAFVIDTAMAGLTLHESEPMMGLENVPLGRITLEHCRVPKTCLLGKVGSGAAVFASVQSWERALLVAPQIGTMQRIVDECVEFAKQRIRSSQPIGKNQAVSHRIADMKIKLETSRLMLYKAAWSLEQGGQNLLDSSLAKTYINESFVDICHGAILCHGGDGYLQETGVERHLRDAIGGTLYGGTVDVQRNVIASLLGL